MALLEDQHLDIAFLLLSSDWFLPYWELAGLRVPFGRRASVQALARQEVRALIGSSKSYWDAEFDPHRLESAGRALVRAISSDGSEIESSSRNDGHVGALLGIVFDACISDTTTFEEQVGAELAAVVRECVRSHPMSFSTIDFEVVARRSASDWDQYLRSLTPDLPTYLSDFASEHFDQAEFASVWVQLAGKLSPDVMEKMAAWLAVQASILVPEATPEINGWLQPWIQRDRP